jgi:hypothetical protein
MTCFLYLHLGRSPNFDYSAALALGGSLIKIPPLTGCAADTGGHIVVILSEAQNLGRPWE